MHSDGSASLNSFVQMLLSPSVESTRLTFVYIMCRLHVFSQRPKSLQTGFPYNPLVNVEFSIVNTAPTKTIFCGHCHKN